MRLHIHWHREVKPGHPMRRAKRGRANNDDIDWYGECRCGHRTWRPLIRGGYWPVDHAWLGGEGIWPGERPIPPPRPTRGRAIPPPPRGQDVRPDRTRNIA